jgi:hypothetical protein
MRWVISFRPAAKTSRGETAANGLATTGNLREPTSQPRGFSVLKMNDGQKGKTILILPETGSLGEADLDPDPQDISGLEAFADWRLWVGMLVLFFGVYHVAFRRRI